MATINLHKFGIVPDEDDSTHVFTFIFENPQRLADGTKAIESSEVIYNGQKWSLVCMKKEERYMGFFLKWKYGDGQSASATSCKAKYRLCLTHRFDYNENKYFSSNQKFSSSQSLLGKSKFVSLDELLRQGAGFLDETGKRVVLELTMFQCVTRFEQQIDTSPRCRTRKNASGYYYDTVTFLHGGHRWYLRVYPSKSNSNGLPAVYLYLSNKPRPVSMELNFTLYVGEDRTEILTYGFGEGAQFDGFGKTLPAPLYNLDKVPMITVGVEMMSLAVFKDMTVSVHGQGSYAPHLYKEYRSYGTGSYGSSLTPAEAFQDHEGNYWKANYKRDSKIATVAFDKGVHHYPHSKTKLLCWSSILLAQDPNVAQDIDMTGKPIVGYFSNFIDEKGYLMTFPIDANQIEQRGNPYMSKSGEILVRVNMLSLQTVPHGMRSIPPFDFQGQHLLQARSVLLQQQRNLEDMRDMAASRGSLSGLCLESPNESRITSPDATTNGKFTTQKSYDSTSETDMVNDEDDSGGRHFFSDVLRHIAAMQQCAQKSSADEAFYTTSRDSFHGTREDVSTESGVAMSDETSLLLEARPSPVDMAKQREIVNTLVKFLKQRLPVRVTEVVEFGSLGSGTCTSSRMDVDLLVYSPDVPSEGQERWMPSLLHAVSNVFQNASANPDPYHQLPDCSYFTTTPYAVQFTCGGVDVDIMISFDWNSRESGGANAIYDVSCKQTTHSGRRWCSLATARLLKQFIADQSNEVKEIIKVVKHWRNCIQWRKVTHRPSSTLISLLTVKAAEETKSYEMKPVLEKLGSYVLAPELSLSWSTYYLSEKYPVEFDPPTPLVRDPTNPGFNVAETLPYWGQFRSEYVQWMRGLGMAVYSNGST